VIVSGEPPVILAPGDRPRHRDPTTSSWRPGCARRSRDLTLNRW